MLTNLIRWAKTAVAATNGNSYQTQLLEYMGRKVKSATLFPYGFAANTPPNNLAISFVAQGSSDNRAHIPLDSGVYPELAEGETALYHPESGSLIVWRSGGKLEITAAGDIDVTTSGSLNATAASATVTAPAIALLGAVTITGSLTVAGASTLAAVTSNGVNIGNTHIHTQANDSAGNAQAPTSPPT